MPGAAGWLSLVACALPSTALELVDNTGGLPILVTEKTSAAVAYTSEAHAAATIQQDCTFGPWTRWSPCIYSCGGGQQTRNRAIKLHAVGAGRLCDGPTAEVQVCNMQPCPQDARTKVEHATPVDCSLSPWSDWGRCVERDQQSRQRLVARWAANGGKPCSAPMAETRECAWQGMSGSGACAISAWEEWSACSGVCDGMRKRGRTIERPAGAGGHRCMGNLVDLLETMPCGGRCPSSHLNGAVRDCVLEPWGAWSICSADIQSSRSRHVSVHPQNGGAGCWGSLSQAKPCTIPCRLFNWSPWSLCTKTCDGGKKTRHRTAETVPQGGDSCHEETESDVCNTQACIGASSCQVSDWSQWQPCSKTCGGGLRSRTRTILGVRVCSWDPSWDMPLMDVQQCASERCAAEREQGTRAHERYCDDIGGIEVGQAVIHQSLGPSLMVCRVISRSDVVGICRPANSKAESAGVKHDDTSAILEPALPRSLLSRIGSGDPRCAAEHDMQFSLCLKGSLTFVPCAELRTETSALALRMPISGQRGADSSKFLSNSLVRYPGVAKNLTETTANAGIQRAQTTTEQPNESVVSTTPVTHYDEKMLEDVRKPMFLLPWLATGASVLCMMLCAGVAIGALCHAQLLHSQARDFRPPLLGADGSQAMDGNSVAVDAE